MATNNTYMSKERARACAWKLATTTLPAAAKVSSPYIAKDGSDRGPARDFCLPADFATLSLLPEVRESSLALFAELGVPWHAGVRGGPSNHLLSSQVQCVNALGQMVSDPGRIVRAFGPVVGTVEVDQIEPGRWLTFEYIGSEDHLNEAKGGIRTRGAHCTSVDAAFIHRTADDVRELILVEWKYTEHYARRVVDGARDAVRFARYGSLVAEPAGPIRSDLLEFGDLLQEPLYQLVRQQLLAFELEKARAHGVERVRVLHVLPADNLAYRSSLAGASYSTLGPTVKDVWMQVLRHSDRFVSVDSAIFLDAAVTSDEYIHRYGDRASS